MDDTYLIKFLNENGAKTSICFSTVTKQFYVSTLAEIKDGPILRSVARHSDTIQGAIKRFNQELINKVIVIDAYKDSRREIFIPDFTQEGSADMSKLFYDTLASVNDFLKRTNETTDNRIYDDNDPDWYMSEITYDEKSDKFYFKCEKVKK